MTAAPLPGGPAAGQAELVIDTREPGDSCAIRAGQAVDQLPGGGSFVLIADHDPRGLHYMFDAERPGVVSWQVLEDGPELWQVRVGKVASPA